MAEATSFGESNCVLDKPGDMSYDECQALSVLRAKTDGGACWKFTKEELDEINKTGRVWLMVYGLTMPPACVCGLKPFRSE